MTPDQQAQLITAAVALAVAMLAYLSAVLRGQAGAIAQSVHTATRLVSAQAAGGGGRPAYPVWNQLADPGLGEGLPTGRYEECGEECCSMVIMEQHGVPTSADHLRVLLGGPARGPLTNADDLKRLLGQCNVPAAVELVDADGVDAALARITQAGGSAIALGRWVAPGVLHWILVTRADQSGCGANDPWMGRRRTWTWAAFHAAYAGELVVVTRQPDAR